MARISRSTPRRAGVELPFRFGQWQLAIPLAAYFACFFLAPIAILVFVSFHSGNDLTTASPAQYVRFASDGFGWKITAYTILLGVKTVIVTSFLSYPVALLYLGGGRVLRRFLLAVIILPLLIGTVVQTFAWVVILGDQGPINNLASWFGLISSPIRLLNNEASLVVQLAQSEMAIMVLALLTVLLRVDPFLLEASTSLGAGPWRTLFRIIMPLSMPGFAAGAIIVFAGAVSAYFSQAIIGGGRLVYLPQYMNNQVSVLFNWPFGAALAVVFTLAVLATITMFALVTRRSAAYVHD